MDSFEKNVTFSIIKKGNCINIDLGVVSNIDLIMGEDDRYINSVAAYFARKYPENTEFLITLAMVDDIQNKFLNRINVNLHNDSSIEFILINNKTLQVIHKEDVYL